MKKFYQSVMVTKQSDGYHLYLDGKAVRTPARQNLIIPSEKLAEAVAEEWRNQGEKIIPETMPLSQLSMTLIDRIIPNRDILQAEILNYLDTDLVCYRASDPEVYKTAQEEHWAPFVNWFNAHYGVVLESTTGLAPLTQLPVIHNKIKTSVENLSPAGFMVVYLTTLGAGSIVMALGFTHGAFTPEQVLNATFVEEQLKDKIYLSEIYGSAPDQDRRVKTLKDELESLRSFIHLV